MMQKMASINLSKSNLNPSTNVPSKALTIINNAKRSFAGTGGVAIFLLAVG